MPEEINYIHPLSIQSLDETDAPVTASPEAPASPRKRGAPKGNSNALKHGFYSRVLKVRDRKGLENTIQINLAEEIDLLRIMIRRMCESFSKEQSLAEKSSLLRDLSLAFLSLNRMVRTQHQLHGDASDPISPVDAAELRQAFDKAHAQLTHEIGFDQRFPSA